MAYTVIASGPQLPVPFTAEASTAAEALTKLRATRTTFGHAVVLDADGREVSIGTLQRIVQEEQEAARRKPGSSDA